VLYERRMSNMSFTYCPYCNGTLTLDEYRNGTVCKYCGGNLAGYSRRFQAVLGLGIAVLFCILTYFYFNSKGGWANAQTSEKEASIILNGLIVSVTVLTFVFNWVLVEVLRTKSKNAGFLLAFIISSLLWFSPVGDYIGSLVLATLG
jgi:hypothetical protein